MTKLTDEMLERLPLNDIHVHLPGTIDPMTAWDLGVRNGFIKISDFNEGGRNKKRWEHGACSLSMASPYEHYADIFKGEKESDIVLNSTADPIRLEYDISHHSFKSFDMIMATVQGHRHPPGGIQNEEDLLMVLDRYLEKCIKDRILYTELQQNIRIAYQIYPHLSKIDARKRLYLLFRRVIADFAARGVDLRFLHCFNKTQIASIKKSVHERSIEAAHWLKEAQEIAPGVFVGIESAGHEKDESGWPIHLKAGYEMTVDLGLQCEAHGGEGIGVEHMMDVIRTLPIKRLAHGFQVIEDELAIEEVKRRGITLVMMPMMNLNLGACIHGVQGVNEDLVPRAKSLGGQKKYVTELYLHPFFRLLRNYGMKIALSSDNPYLGGMPLKETIRIFAGLVSDYYIPEPLSAEEVMLCCESGIDAAFCDDKVKLRYRNELLKWSKSYALS